MLDLRKRRAFSRHAGLRRRGGDADRRDKGDRARSEPCRSACSHGHDQVLGLGLGQHRDRAPRALELNGVRRDYAGVSPDRSRGATLKRSLWQNTLSKLTRCRYSTLQSGPFCISGADTRTHWLRRSERSNSSHATMEPIILGVIYQSVGETAGGLAVFDGPEFRESPYMALAYAWLGRRDDALRVLDRMEKAREHSTFRRWLSPISRWETRSAGSSGSPERSISGPATSLSRTSNQGLTHPLDPRFKALVAHLKLPQ